MGQRLARGGGRARRKGKKKQKLGKESEGKRRNQLPLSQEPMVYRGTLKKLKYGENGAITKREKKKKKNKKKKKKTKTEEANFNRTANHDNRQ